MTEFKPTKAVSKSEKMVVSIRLERDKLTEIDDIAHKADISRNELILQCVDFALNHISVVNCKKSQ